MDFYQHFLLARIMPKYVKHFPLEFTLSMRSAWCDIFKYSLYFLKYSWRKGIWAMDFYQHFLFLFSTTMLFLSCATSSIYGSFKFLVTRKSCLILAKDPSIISKRRKNRELHSWLKDCPPVETLMIEMCAMAPNFYCIHKAFSTHCT